MRKLLPLSMAAVAAVGGTALATSVLVGSGVAGAKAPVSATCTSLSGDTTIAIETGGTAASLLSGCTSSSTKVTSYGVDTSTLNSELNGGTGTIDWTSGKDTTYSYSVASTTGLDCGTFLDQAATGQETITISDVGGTAKVNEGGTFNVCYWLGSSDGTVHEQSVGSVTI